MNNRILCCIRFFIVFLCITIIGAQGVLAGNGDMQDMDANHVQDVSYSQRVSLARSFVSRLKSGMHVADVSMERDGIIKDSVSIGSNILPEGEMLLLRPILEKNFRVDGIIMGRVHNDSIAVSLNDFSDILQLAIQVDINAQVADGWYIRESKYFHLNMVDKIVKTDNGEFKVSDETIIDDADIFVPVEELAVWMGMDMNISISSQEIKIISKEELPVQAKYNRTKKNIISKDSPDPTLPLGGSPYRLASIPTIDVSTRSTYNKRDIEKEGTRDHDVNIGTAGDFAKGTLTTQSRINDEEQLASVRATYKRDSLDRDLMGPLKANHLEIGDITTIDTPLGGQVSQELGVRINNIDPLNSFSRATTVISGSAIPGWDVELFRNSQFLGIANVGDDGFYRFEDVVLFHDDNNFRLVFYGPQGEVREETVFVPFDRDLQSRGGGIYDVSVSFDGENTYTDVDLRGRDEDRGSANIAALYEKPLASGITGSVGFRSGNQDDIRNTVVNAGLSASLDESLVNLDAAVDDEGELASEVSVRRDFGEHEVNLTNSWQGSGFDDASTSSIDSDAFESIMRVNGPLRLSEVFSPHYSASVDYLLEDGEDYQVSTTAGLNGGWKNISLSGNLRHKIGNIIDDDTLDTTVSASGVFKGNRLRLTANYEVSPDQSIDSLAASYSRKLTNDVGLDIDVSKDQDASLTEYQARLDWQAGFIHISPSIRYDTDHDFFAGLNTRFGITQEPVTGDVKMFSHSITNYAFASAFVYLDKNGDGSFDGDDEPIKDVTVLAPQNGRRAVTNEKGVALFSRMTRLHKTDIYVDGDSLQDPAWISGFDGVSIIPRDGYVAQVEFPVHVSGELDGTVYANVVPLPDDAENSSGESDENKALDGQNIKEVVQPVALRNIELHLYNDKGAVEQSVVTDPDGFYYFTHIPPGRYFLMIDEKSASRKNIIRPKPQPIEIGYDGTLIYDNKIFVDTGAGDVPSEIIADMKDFEERHPQINFSDKESYLALNLGEYNSSLLMSLIWYKLRTRYGAIIGGAKPFVPSGESYVDAKTGKHTLLVGLDEEKTLDEAYNMCRSLIAREQACKVEIFPAYIKEAASHVSNSSL